MTSGAQPGTGGGELLIAGGDGPGLDLRPDRRRHHRRATTATTTSKATTATTRSPATATTTISSAAVPPTTASSTTTGSATALLDSGRDARSTAAPATTGSPATTRWSTATGPLLRPGADRVVRRPARWRSCDLPARPAAGTCCSATPATDMIFGQGNGAQPATQTDPDDGRNNDFVGTAPASADFDSAVTGTADEDQAAWLGDSIYGGLGDDYVEGNHGNDLIFGNGTAAVGHDEDDINGGGSANDGKHPGQRPARARSLAARWIRHHPRRLRRRHRRRRRRHRRRQRLDPTTGHQADRHRARRPAGRPVRPRHADDDRRRPRRARSPTTS